MPHSVAAYSPASASHPRRLSLNAVALACALFSGVLGVAVLTGWYTRNPRLVQIHESFAPMQFNTALGFLLLGVALTAGCIEWRRIRAICATVVMALGAVTLAEYGSGFSFGIDEAFMEHYITVETSHPGRMAPNSALCFLLSGSALLLSRSRFRPLAGVSASVVVALGFVAMAGYLSGIASAYGWGELTRMALHTSVGFVVFGAGAAALVLNASGSPALARWLSVAAGLGVVTAGIALWQALVHEQRLQVEARIDARRSELLAVIEYGIESRATALERMANRWRDAGEGQEALWRADAHQCIMTIPGFQAIEWVDTTFHVRWVEPVAGNENAVGLNLATEPTREYALREAERRGTPTVSEAIDLVQGGKGFLWFFPVVPAERTQGFIVGVFRIDDLFDTLTESVSTDFDVALYEGGERIYGRDIAGDAPLLPLMAIDNLWTIQLLPKPTYLNLLRSNLPLMVLVSSVLVGLLITIIVFLAQTAFRHLIEARSAHGDLSESEIYHRGVVEALPIGLLSVDPEGKIQAANTGALRMVGYERKDLIGLHIDRLLSNGDYHDFESESRDLRVLTKDGRRVPVEVSVTPLTHHHAPQNLVTLMDLTERKKAQESLQAENAQRQLAERELALLNEELEQRVVVRTAELSEANRELEEANEELDEFTYFASHDLQEPLRKQQMFTDVLTEEAGDGLNEDAKRALRAVNSAAARMQSLVQSLLALSRARNRDLQMRPSSLKHIAEEAVTTLSLPIQEAQAEVTIEELPEVDCDPVLILHVFQNLIANGVRYRDKERPCRIRVSSAIRDGHVEVAIEDTGIGIEPQHFNAIFSAFKRLHSRHDYPGTGIGLAICRKCIERHGGIVWVTSTPGEGSVFRFTIPLHPHGGNDA